MKSILMSIYPKWIKKIASGEKTVEVRKTVPKCGTPFKVYMYCTTAKSKDDELYKGACSIDPTLCNGKVVGEFVCDCITDFWADNTGFEEVRDDPFYMPCGFAKKATCLTNEQFVEYGKGALLYGLHISDLKIYDTPKELSEFHKPLRCGNFKCAKCGYWIHRRCNIDWSIKRPPQSWQYVEEQGVER